GVSAVMVGSLSCRVVVVVVMAQSLLDQSLRLRCDHPQSTGAVDEVVRCSLGELGPEVVDPCLVGGDEPARGAFGAAQLLAVQLCQCPLHSVRVDTELASQVPDAGDPPARCPLAGDDPPGELGHELSPDGGAGVELHVASPCVAVLSA